MQKWQSRDFVFGLGVVSLLPGQWAIDHASHSILALGTQNNSTGGTMAEKHQGDDANRLSEDIKALVYGANFAHLATLMRDGSPQVDPVGSPWRAT
jgi:hypothetical protein